MGRDGSDSGGEWLSQQAAFDTSDTQAGSTLSIEHLQYSWHKGLK